MNPPLQKNRNIHEDCLLDFLGHAIHKGPFPKAITALNGQVEAGMQWDSISYEAEQKSL